METLTRVMSLMLAVSTICTTVIISIWKSLIGRRVSTKPHPLARLSICVPVLRR